MEPKKDETESPKKALERKLAAARAERIQLEERGQEAVLERELALELKRIEALKTLAKLKDEHGADKVAGLLTPGADLIAVKRELAVVWDRYEASKKEKSDEAALIQACLVHPTKMALEELLDSYPIMSTHTANAIGELFGMGAGEVLKG